MIAGFARVTGRLNQTRTRVPQLSSADDQTPANHHAVNERWTDCSDAVLALSRDNRRRVRVAQQVDNRFPGELALFLFFIQVPLESRKT